MSLRARLNGVLGAALLLAVASGWMLARGPEHGWAVLHRVSCAALSLGVAAHLGLHGRWIRQAFRRRPRPVRRHLYIDLALLLLFLLTLVSAPDHGAGAAAFRLHGASGLAMAVLAAVHLGMHRTAAAGGAFRFGG